MTDIIPGCRERTKFKTASLAIHVKMSTYMTFGEQLETNRYSVERR